MGEDWDEDWEKAKGDVCPSCFKETLQFFLSRRNRKVCRECYLEDENYIDKKRALKRARRLVNRGGISLKSLREGNL